MKHKGRCVKFLYRELNAPKEALILGCVFEGTEPSISRGFYTQASQKIRRHDDKPIPDVRMPGSIEVWHLLLPLWGKVGMGICLEDKKIGRYDDKKVSYLPLINLVPSPTRGANLRTDDAKLVRIARKLSKLEPKVLLRNFPSVEQIQDKVGMG